MESLPAILAILFLPELAVQAQVTTKMQNCDPEGNVDAMILIAQVEQSNQNDSILQGIAMVDIPAGRFQMGCSAGDADCEVSEKPAHEVSVPGFRMSRYDVTVGQFSSFVRATGHRERSRRC